MRPTPEQEAVLGAAGDHVPVAAGAGAGKTTVLVERIWRDIEDDGLDPGEILVATYNRAAAAHLRTRLQDRFADPAGGRGPGRAGLDLSAAWIGTFHSLCARMVREHPFAAGVDPAFTELDDMEQAALMEGALQDALAEVTHPGLLEALAQATTDNPLRSAVLACHARLRAAGIERPRITVPDARPVTDRDIAAAMELVEEVDAHPSRADRHQPGIEAARLMLGTRAAVASTPKIHGVAAQALRPLVVAANEALADVWARLVEDLARPQLEGIAALLERLDTLYAERKRTLGALDYEDLQLHALRVLDAGRPYRFRRVYVDEFQDANAVQDRIITALAAERTWVVGDPLQAIYGFRHATPEHFVRRVGDPPRHRLADNHRSRPALMTALNDLLGHVLAAEPGFHPLTPAAPEPAEGPGTAGPPVRLVSVLPPAGARCADRDQEAEVVADQIVALLDEGHRPGDVAVLFRALTAVEPFEAALRARGVPVHLVAGRGFFTHQQIADVLALLWVVDNPHHEEHLVRVLASPYAAASDEDLLALRRLAGDGGPLWPAVAGVPALAGLPGIVDRLRPVLREAGLAALVEAAVAAADHDLAVLGMHDGERRYANLRRLVRMAEAFAAVRGPDLHGFLVALADREGLGQDPGEAVLVDPDLDAVRLTTIHAVKGQEFPAVVVADGSHGRPTAAPSVLVDPDGRAGIRVGLAGGDPAQVLGYADLHTRARAADRAEERRVLYVALTRGMRRVVVVGRPGTSGVADTAYGMVRAAVDAGAPVEHIQVTPAVAAASPTLPRPGAPPVVDAEAPPPPAPVMVDPAGGVRLSFSSLAVLAHCPRRFHLEYELGLHGPADAVIPEPGAPDGGGARVGDLVHERLADHRWGGPAPAPGWAVERTRGAAPPPPPAHLRRAEEAVARAVTVPVAARLAAAAECHAEHGFAITVGSGLVVSGSMDVLAVEADGARLVVDWKTHALGDRAPDEVVGGYELQRTVYGLAALRAGAPRVELAWVFTDRPDRPCTRTVTDADIPALEGAVLAVAGLLSSPGRPVGPAALGPGCSRCPGLRGGCPVGAGHSPRGAQMTLVA